MPKTFDPVKQILKEKEQKTNIDTNATLTPLQDVENNDKEMVPEQKFKTPKCETSNPTITQESLERRLKIEEEVTFVC